jgi:hypothetical protein
MARVRERAQAASSRVADRHVQQEEDATTDQEGGEERGEAQIG